MLVICLLAASFTGCLGSDDIVDEVPVEEEETIEPVGMGDNDGNETTYVYANETNNYYSDNEGNSTTDCVCNCTLIVEGNSYDPEHFSSVFISNQPEGSWQRYGDTENNTWEWVENSDGNDFTIDLNFRGWFNKTGNDVHITPTYNDHIYTDFWHKITIYGPDGLYWEDYVIMVRTFNAAEMYIYINEIDIELPWEPVGFTLQNTYTTSLHDNHLDNLDYVSITRAF